MSYTVAWGMHINSTSTTGVSALPLPATAHTSTSDSPDAQWQWQAALVVFQLCFYGHSAPQTAAFTRGMQAICL